MRPEVFFEKFDELAETPNALAKMRDLVLRLAIQGRLSARLADDTPVNELRVLLANARAQRVSPGDSAQGSLVVSGSGSPPFLVPRHWDWLPLNCIGALSGGMTPPKANSRYWGGDVNWFSPKDIKADELTESELKITEDGVAATGLQVYPPGCLFMVARSGILKRTFPVAINRVPATANQDIKVLTPFLGGMERYLQVMLRGMTPFILSSLVKTGTTVQSLKYEEFEAQRFPLPPLAEQKRIVAKVDELMALCDRLEAGQRQRDTRRAALTRASLARFTYAPTPANLNFLFHDAYSIEPGDLRRTILTLAFEGKLASQDVADEPADVLLKRLTVERSSEMPIRRARVSPLLVESAPYVVPPGWRWARFEDVAHIASHLVNPKEFMDSIHLAPDNIEKGTGVLLPCRTIREDNVISSNHRFEAGQIVYSKIRPNLAKVVVVKFDGLCSADMYPIDALIDVDYLHRYMLSDTFLAQAVRTDTRVAMPKINQSELNAISVPVAPIAEQRRIVERVEQLLGMVDRLEAHLDSAQSTLARLLDALVADLTRRSAIL